MDVESFTLAAVVSDLARAVDVDLADAIEFRMDLAAEPLSQLSAYAGTLPIIATNRAAWEGGEAESAGRLEALADAGALPEVAAVDVELRSVEAGEADAVVSSAREHGTLVIVSWHDFETTPPREELSGRLREASRHADIAKLAVTADAVGDVLDLLAVTHEMTQQGIPVATMSMGSVGRHSRVIAPLYGSRIGYAPVDPPEATAPGQYDLRTLAELLAALR